MEAIAGLDNLVVFVDYNNGSWTATLMRSALRDLRAKWEQFGWHAQEVDGHDVAEIYAAIQAAKAAKGKSSVIILNTVKGKGCHFAEGVKLNHHMRFTQEQIAEAIERLEGGRQN